MRVFSKILVILVIIALAFTGVYFYKTYYKNEKDEKEKSVDWKNVYSEIIADKSNFNDLDEIKLELCDLDKDNVPELIVIGEKEKEIYGAKIYRINKENKVDTVKFELEEEFSLKFLKNIDKDTYNWYVVTDDDKIVYELEAKDKDYNIKKSEYVYSDDFEVIEKGKEISFDIEEDDAQKIMKKLEDSYKPNKELVPEKNKNNSSDKENQNNVSNISNTTNTSNTKNKNNNNENTNKNSSVKNKSSNTSKNQNLNDTKNKQNNNTSSNNVSNNTVSNNEKNDNKTSKKGTTSNTTKKLDEIFDSLR